MKRIYGLLLVAVLVLTATCAAMAEDLKQGPEIYVDYGLGGTSNFNLDSGSSDQYKKIDFGQSVIGAEYLVSKWKLGIEYAWANDYNLESNSSPSGYTLKSDSSLTLLKAGYPVISSNQFQLYVNGVYFQNKLVFKYAGSSDSGKYTFDTNGLLIGPEMRYTFNDKLQVQGFFGYGVYVSQKETDKYSDGTTESSNADDESMTFLNVKLIYSFADHWAATMGYRVKEIKSKVSYPAYDDYKFTDKQDMLTVGVAYKF